MIYRRLFVRKYLIINLDQHSSYFDLRGVRGWRGGGGGLDENYANLVLSDIELTFDLAPHTLYILKIHHTL